MTKRRRYSDEFKLDAIRLVKKQGYNRSEAARNLGIDSEMLGRWILEQERKESVSGLGSPAGNLQDEVKRLREENRKLKMEREILVKAAGVMTQPNLHRSRC